MQRYFVSPKQIVDNSITISGDDFHHIKNVMRMSEGNKVLVCDEESLYLCTVNTFYEKEVVLNIEEEVLENTELPIDVTIAQGMIRREKNEEVLRRLVELGANCYLNVMMERSIVKIKNEEKIDKTLLRFQKIIKEAAEQSHRHKLMKYKGVYSFNEFIKMGAEYDLCLFAYEEAGRQKDHTLPKLLSAFNKKILIIVGPEGGFAPTEVSQLLENGFIPIGLGSRILRTETAPLYLMSVIAYECEVKNED